MGTLANCARVALLSVAVLGVTTTSRVQSQFAQAQNDVVVFLGGTNMVRLQRARYLEAMLKRAFAAARPKFRDYRAGANTPAFTVTAQ